MADTSIQDETVTPEAPSNEPGTTAAPATVNSSADVEQAKRDAEAQRLRANQLQNELEKVKQEREANERQKLEETQEYKALYEKTQSELKQIQDTQAAQERDAQLKTATDSIFKDYPTEVVELAKTTGVRLTDDSESAQTTLKETLDAIKEKVAPGTQVTSSNPPVQAPAETGQTGGLGRPRQLGIDNGQTAITDSNPQKVGEYIRKLPAIDRMKRDAGVLQ